MKSESQDRKRKILSAICEMQVDVQIYLAKKGRGENEVVLRQRCLEAMLADAAALKHSNLVLDRDETLELRDRRVIADALDKLSYRSQLRYTHDKVTQDPLLLVPDAIAWAWPQRGHWQKSCLPVVRNVREL